MSPEADTYSPHGFAITPTGEITIPGFLGREEGQLSAGSVGPNGAFVTAGLGLSLKPGGTNVYVVSFTGFSSLANSMQTFMIRIKRNSDNTILDSLFADFFFNNALVHQTSPTYFLSTIVDASGLNDTVSIEINAQSANALLDTNDIISYSGFFLPSP